MYKLKDLNNLRVALFSYYGVEAMRLVPKEVASRYLQIYECQARDLRIPVKDVYELAANTTALTPSAEEAFVELNQFLDGIGVALQPV